MAIQVINDPYRTAGGALTQGMSGALKGILNGMIQQRAQQQKQAAYEASGFSPEQSAQYAAMDPKSLNALFHGMEAKQKGSSQENMMIGLLGAGYSPEEAMLLSHLNPASISSIIKNRTEPIGMGDTMKNLIAQYQSEMRAKKYAVPKGKTRDLDQDALNYFVEMARGNKQKAISLAQKSGYKIPKELLKQLKTRKRVPMSTPVKLNRAVPQQQFSQMATPFTLSNLLSNL